MRYGLLLDRIGTCVDRCDVPGGVGACTAGIDTSGTLGSQVVPLSGAGSVFIGVLSDTPIARIQFNHPGTGDNVGFFRHRPGSDRLR